MTASGGGRKRVTTEPDFIVCATEEPLPVIRPSGSTDESVTDRLFSLEMDELDWQQRDAIMAQYGASVRERLQQVDPSLGVAAAAPVVAKPPALSSSFGGSAGDDLDLPPLTDTRLGESFDNAGSNFPGGFYGATTMAPPPPMHAPMHPGTSMLAPPPMAVFQTAPLGSKVPPPALHTPSYAAFGSMAAPPPPPPAMALNASIDSGMDEQDTEAAISSMKPRRKWVKMERIPGQVELYKWLERALKDLKDCKTHATPFMSKVKATDAPEYYTIITRPMHFAEIQRKLSLNLYYSKADFEADLNLIWENCRRYNTDPGSIFIEHASQMEKRQAKFMKKVPDIDLTPYKDQILAENATALSPAMPRMMMSSSIDAAHSASGPSSAAASPAVPPIKVSLGASGQHFTMGGSMGGGGNMMQNPSAMAMPTYTTLLANPSKRRKALMEMSDKDLFLAVFDPTKSPESAIEGKILPPEACYLPPVAPHLYAALTGQVQMVLSMTLAHQPAPGPVVMPIIHMPDDAKNYADPQERQYVAITRAQRLKARLDRQPEEKQAFAAKRQLTRDSGDMGFNYVASHPEVVETTLAAILRRKEAVASQAAAAQAAAGASAAAAAAASAAAAAAAAAAAGSPPKPGGPPPPQMSKPISQPGFTSTSAPPPPPSLLSSSTNAAAGSSDATPPSYPRIYVPELIPVASNIPEPPFFPGSVLEVSPAVHLDMVSPKQVPLPEVVLLKDDQRSADLNIDAIRTITRAKVTRDSLTLVMTGYARDAAEAKTPHQRGLLDEAQVQTTATLQFSTEAERGRRQMALRSCGAFEMYNALLSNMVVMFLSRMGVDQAARPAVTVLTDMLVSRFEAFAQSIKRDMDGNSLRAPEEQFMEALKVFNATDAGELVSWYDANVVQYAEQMLSSEKTLKERIQQVETERLKRHENLQEFLRVHATPGTELKKTHDTMLEAQKQMAEAQKAYYEAKQVRKKKGKERNRRSEALRGNSHFLTAFLFNCLIMFFLQNNLPSMTNASGAYAKAQETFRKHAKIIQDAAAKHEAQQKVAQDHAAPMPSMSSSTLAPPPPLPTPVMLPPPPMVAPPPPFMQTTTDDSKRRKME